ncbi:hypothetical protein [Pyrobaculum aerophilum]|uniref:Homing endonuclease LAGLIDADG domain-containing protein n=1 Tax=Pyrobaculum aerophilum TaxID=13773 RepID=A0A832T0Q0_9CREN|nr:MULTISPECIES: hypothetical protein [Pyrobaculum]MCX8137031.1 hypothetical protein [Pyrobaculum aerophilum]HII47107.1 hypothetical protein [Pyrobaculum aerophilum]
MPSHYSRRLIKAYISGVAVNGCEARGVKAFLLQWFNALGFEIRGTTVVLPKSYCKYTPKTVLEHVYFIKGAFETYGEFFMGDPHGGEVIIIFKSGSKKLAKSLRLLGFSPLETTDESGASRYLVLYERPDVRRFVKLIKPVVEEAHIAKALGLCPQR